MAKNTEVERQPLPPYVSFKTLEGFIGKLKETTVPARIDLSVLRNYANSVARQLIVALKWLELIAENGTTSEKLNGLVKSYGSAEWGDVLNQVIFDAYNDLIGDLDLDTATPAQLAEKFRAQGAEGEVLDKCISFYLNALRSAGTTLSPHIMNRPRGRPASRGKVRRTSVESVPLMPAPGEQSPAGTVGTVRFSFPIPDKPSVTMFLPADLVDKDWEMIDAMVRAYIARKEKSK